MLTLLWQRIRQGPAVCLLVLFSAVFAGERLAPGAHTMLFVLWVPAIVVLAAPLSPANESVAAKTGEAVTRQVLPPQAAVVGR